MLHAPAPERVVRVRQFPGSRATDRVWEMLTQRPSAATDEIVRELGRYPTVNQLHSDVSDRAHAELTGRAFRIDIGQGTTGSLCRPPGWFPMRRVAAPRSCRC